MKSLAFLSFGALLATASAAAVDKRQGGVVALALQRKHVGDPAAHDRNRMRRRDDTVTVSLTNEQSLYYAKVAIGTPAQDFMLDIDTGSSDLWVNAKGSSLCDGQGSPCTQSGTYDANSSSTYEFVASTFNISYVDGSGAAGDYVTDKVAIGGETVDSLQFGIGYSSSSPQGVLGVGYIINEAIIKSGVQPYDNLPAKLTADGTISTNAYSLYLDDREANTGSLLLGGVDHSQYSGDLVTVPINAFQREFAEFFVTLTGWKLGSDSFSSDMSLGVLLDSGTFLTYLPNDLVQWVYDKVDADYEANQGVAYVDCDLAKQDADMTFSFSNAIDIVVPISEMVMPQTDTSGQPLTFTDGTSACLFGLAPASSGTNLLGDTFLRSAYVVYNLDSNEISLAQSNFDAKDSDVEAIGTGSNAVPSATAASNPAAAQSGIPDNAESGGGSIDSVHSGDSGSGSGDDGSSSGDDGDSDGAAGMLSPSLTVVSGAAAVVILAFSGLF